MPVFKYRAIDLDGKAVEGTMEEASAARLTALLQERGWQVSSVEPVKQTRSLFRPGARLSWEDLLVFNEQLLAITKSGFPLAPSLKTLAQDARSPRLRRVLENVRRHIESGASLEEALARHPQSFSPVYLSLIRAGERTGNLAGVLEQLMEQSEASVRLKYNLQQAFAYPVLVLGAALAVVVLLLTEVVPQFEDIFTDFGTHLPAFTQFWLDLGQGVRQNFPVLAVVAVVCLIIVYSFIRQAARIESWGQTLDRFKMAMPILGRFYYLGSMGRFARSLGLLLAGGVPMVESLILAGATCGNAVLLRAVEKAARRVENGDRVSDALESTDEFEHTFCWLLATAEDRGDVPAALFQLADTYQRRHGRMDQLIMRWAGPVCVVFIAVVVGSIILAMYLPIFSLGDVMGF